MRPARIWMAMSRSLRSMAVLAWAMEPEVVGRLWFGSSRPSRLGACRGAAGVMMFPGGSAVRAGVPAQQVAGARSLLGRAGESAFGAAAFCALGAEHGASVVGGVGFGRLDVGREPLAAEAVDGAVVGCHGVELLSGGCRLRPPVGSFDTLL